MLAALETLREGLPGCPSDLQLDRLVSGELPSAATGAVDAHLVRCVECARRVAVRRHGFAVFPEVSPVRLFSRIQRRLARPEAPPTWRERLRRWRATMFGGLAFAAAAGLAVGDRPKVPVDLPGRGHVSVPGVAGPAAAPRCPAGCTLAPFVLDRGR